MARRMIGVYLVDRFRRIPRTFCPNRRPGGRAGDHVPHPVLHPGGDNGPLSRL